MTFAKGDFLMFIDDDDCYIPNAISTIVRPWLAVEPNRPHMFRIAGFPIFDFDLPPMMLGATIAWPRVVGKLGTWDDDPHASEITFIRQSLAHYPEGMHRHDEAVYLWRPHTEMGRYHYAAEIRKLHVAQL